MLFGLDWFILHFSHSVVSVMLFGFTSSNNSQNFVRGSPQTSIHSNSDTWPQQKVANDAGKWLYLEGHVTLSV